MKSAEASTQSGWERRQERTRADVLVAVGEIIAAEGLEGLTMRKLAARACVAVATLYNQFGDRGGVLVAFVSNGLDQLEVGFGDQPDPGAHRDDSGALPGAGRHRRNSNRRLASDLCESAVGSGRPWDGISRRARGADHRTRSGTAPRPRRC